MFFLGILLSFLFFLQPCHADIVDTQLSRDKVTMGETLMLSFTLNKNLTATSPDFSALAKDFRIVSANYGNRINILNGVTTTQTFWHLTVEPRRPGVINIPEINFGTDQSAPRQLVVEQKAYNAVKARPDAPVFMKAEVSSTSPYIQSQVIYTVKLFFQTRLENPRIEIPQIKDATFIQVGDGRQYQTNINGKVFTVVEKNFALFPQKVGAISVPASHLSAYTVDFNTISRDDPFAINMPREISLATRDYTLNVKPVPDNYQGTTWLPAENISLTEKWSVDPSAQWESGDPVTRIIQVEAQGLRADQIPDFAVDKIPGVKVYIDPAKRSNAMQGNTVIGTLEQKVTYIPDASQSFAIPALKLHWWNTQTNSNAVAQLNSVAVHVKLKNASNNDEAANNMPAKNAKPVASNTAGIPISATLPDTLNRSAPFYSTFWFWISASLLILWLLTIGLFWSKRRAQNIQLASSKTHDAPANNPADLNEETFQRACEQNNAALAQQYLLSWAKKQWPDTPLNLEKLSDSINDEKLKIAIDNLEQGIYAKHAAPWNGRELFTAYQQMKKHRKYSLAKYIPVKNASHAQHDPLPLLNPDSVL
jgi:hypothetical protein